MADMAATTNEQPYWSQREGVAPVKAEYVLWDRIPTSWRDVVRPNGVSDGITTAKTGELPAPPELDDDDAAEGRTGPTKTVPDKSDLTRSTEEPPHKRQKGANKNRQFTRVQDEGVKLCQHTATGQDCQRKQQGLDCHLAHDLQAYLASNAEENIPLDRPDNPGPTRQSCILFDSLGHCPFGFRCRFSDSHIVRQESGGFQDSGLTLQTNESRLRAAAPDQLCEASLDALTQWATETRGELNVVNQSTINAIRKDKTDSLPVTRAYLEGIGEMLDTRPGMQAKANAKWGKNKKQRATDSTTGSVEADAGKDAPETPLKHTEKKRLRFEGGLYLAPLTTVGNLPFRRVCVEYGADITCGEMGLAHEYMIGNKSEWSLVRRHPSERTFGVQLCGSRPQTLVASTEILVRECPDLDFIDVNLGCPIDLVVKKGAGSALLDQATRLGKILKGMNYASGSVPTTIKMRTGIKTGYNTTHKLMPKAVQEWGVGAVTIHGRTQQQRYSKTADYDYIKTCVDTLRNTADELDLPTIPIFGNGDAYDHRSYWQNVEETGVDGIMVARGALVKPWIFTELKERRDWDISSRERLDMIGKLAKHGLEHWGTDNQGINTARRFLCEAISFTYRYVPVGLLERLPAKMNERPYPFKGRDDLETLLASDNSDDWVKISSMFLGPPPADFKFTPKHKSNAYGSTNESNG